MKKKKIKAFTLVELVVTLAVSAILLTMTSAIFIYYNHSYQEQRIANTMVSESFAFKNKVSAVLYGSTGFSIAKAPSGVSFSFSMTSPADDYEFIDGSLIKNRGRDGEVAVYAFSNDCEVTLESKNISEIEFASFSVYRRDTLVLNFILKTN